MFPLFFMTICKRFGIESLKFLKYFVDISWHHTFFSSSCRILRMAIFFSNIFFFVLCQQFSIGFKSGLLPGIPERLFAFVQDISLAFWPYDRVRCHAWTLQSHECGKSWACALPRLAGRVQRLSFCFRGESTGLPCLFPQKNILKPLPTADVSWLERFIEDQSNLMILDATLW